MYLKPGVIQIFFRLVEPLFSKFSCCCEIKHVNYGSLRQAHMQSVACVDEKRAQRKMRHTLRSEPCRIAFNVTGKNCTYRRFETIPNK